MSFYPIRLGVNVDHVATLRNARSGAHPCPVRAAIAAREAGANGITAHLREDRRHIRDEDMIRLKAEAGLPLNFEMAATEEMLMKVLTLRPNACCLVPEKRQELTTEGGLDVVKAKSWLTALATELRSASIRSSFFIDAELPHIDAAKECGADIVEIHTGRYCDAQGDARKAEWLRIRNAAKHAAAIGLEVHAGHGLAFDTVMPIASILEIEELNIGHFLIGESVYMGLGAAVQHMRALMDRARQT